MRLWNIHGLIRHFLQEYSDGLVSAGTRYHGSIQSHISASDYCCWWCQNNLEPPATPEDQSQCPSWYFKQDNASCNTAHIISYLVLVHRTNLQSLELIEPLWCGGTSGMLCSHSVMSSHQHGPKCAEHSQNIIEFLPCSQEKGDCTRNLNISNMCLHNTGTDTQMNVQWLAHSEFWFKW